VSGGRVVFDLSSAARWSGPPVGIVRAQRELARWARDHRPDVVFALFDPRGMDYRAVSPRLVDAFIAGEATLNAWNMPDATGARVRRGAWMPLWLSNILQARRTSLRILERIRLDERRPGLSRMADQLQRPLISRRYHASMINPDGSRRGFLTPDMVFGAPLELTAADTLVCAGFGWSHSNIEAIARAKAKAGFRFVVLCYDLIPLLRPDLFKPRDVEDMRRYWAGALVQADRIIVNAQAVAVDVRQHAEALGLAPPPIDVRPLGANPATVRADAATALPPGLEAGQYALFVSTIEPRKGHDLLYRVWLRLLAAGVPQAHGFKLAFVGRFGWMVEELEAALKTDARISGSLLALGHVGDAELDLIYRRAAFCVYPSQLEGFGLPVVEAFARGKPVLVSEGGALAEVAGDFSPGLPARDEDAWFRRLKLWIEDPAARAPFEVAISERFSPIGWDEAAAGIFESVARAAAEPPQP